MTIEFVEDAATGDRPFRCFLSSPELHHQNDMNAFVAPDGDATRYADPYVPPDLLGRPGDWQGALPDYNGMCARIDECVGRVRGALESLDAADIDVPDDVAGRSLLDVFEGSGADWREAVFVQISDGARSSRALRTDRWKYAVTSPEAGEDEKGHVREAFTE